MSARSATTTSVSPTRSRVRIDRELGVSSVAAGRVKRDIELAVSTDQLSRVGSCQGGGIVSEGRAFRRRLGPNPRTEFLECQR